MDGFTYLVIASNHTTQGRPTTRRPGAAGRLHLQHAQQLRREGLRAFYRAAAALFERRADARRARAEPHLAPPAAAARSRSRPASPAVVDPAEVAMSCPRNHRQATARAPAAMEAASAAGSIALPRLPDPARASRPKGPTTSSPRSTWPPKTRSARPAPARFPDDGILAEERGHSPGAQPLPLDHRPARRHAQLRRPIALLVRFRRALQYGHRAGRARRGLRPDPRRTCSWPSTAGARH